MVWLYCGDYQFFIFDFLGERTVLKCYFDVKTTGSNAGNENLAKAISESILDAMHMDSASQCVITKVFHEISAQIAEKLVAILEKLRITIRDIGGEYIAMSYLPWATFSPTLPLRK